MERKRTRYASSATAAILWIAILSLLFLPDRQTVCEEEIMPGLIRLNRPEILGLMFYPHRNPRNNPPAGARDMDIPVGHEVILGCRLFTADKEAPLILFFHGNGEIVSDYDDIGPYYNDQGLNFLVADYRGYGWSNGTPTADSLIADARIVFEKTVEWLRENGYSGKIFVMGRSLGSACAIDLAMTFGNGISGLIIESGFAETVPLMRTLGIDLSAMGITEEDCFNNQVKIKSVTAPTYILHGQMDSLIPLGHAEQLHAASGARTKELQVVPGADHNSMIAVAGMLYFKAIKNFIDKVTGASGWREKRKRFRQQP